MNRATIAGAFLLATVAAGPAAAQSTRTWELCFQTGIGSCTTIELTTTALMIDGFRVGTDFGLRVRQTDGIVAPAAIWSLSFAYDDLLSPADGGGLIEGITPAPEGGATPLPGPGGWSAWTESSTSIPSSNSLWLYNSAFIDDGLGGPLETQAIAGCTLGPGGAVDLFGTLRTDLQSCGATAWYAFDFSSSAILDADRFQSMTVDLWTGTELGTAFCAAPLNGEAGFAFDGVNFDLGGCDAQLLGDSGAGDPAVVPEPATMTLLATGLLGLAAQRRRGRKRL